MDKTPHPTQRERSPLLRVFGDVLAGRVAGLIRERPKLVARLIMAPPEAVHSIGAYLHLAPDATLPDAAVADRLVNTKPRDLLAAAMPNCPVQLYRALGRAGDRVHGRIFYIRIGGILNGPFADMLLDATSIDDSCLNHIESLAKMDPEVAAIFAKLKDRYHAEAADSLVTFLRAYNVLGENDLRLPPRAGLPALVRRLTQALARIPAPDPGFTVPPPYRLVASSAELQRIATEFQNCLQLHHWNAAEHHLRLINGNCAYLVADGPRVLVALHRVVGNLWVLEQMVGPKNAAPPEGAQARLLQDLTASGIRILKTDPQAGLGRLYSATQRQRNRADDGLDDALDEDDETTDEIAA
ncbi:MAG: hypothetical protein EOP69_01495 [Spirochaetia bacterium]|nr:MAG: hypothetical protein EOP69_01495 [Spirochaetia bacterium]